MAHPYYLGTIFGPRYAEGRAPGDTAFGCDYSDAVRRRPAISKRSNPSTSRLTPVSNI